MSFIIITGLSGGGKNTALRTLEDAGFFVIDNLPPQLWFHLDTLATDKQLTRVAITTDIRTRPFLESFQDSYIQLKQQRHDVKIVYLEAEDHILLGRYNLSRREHPLEGQSLMLDVARERQMLASLRSMADFVIDTTSLSAKQFSTHIRQLFEIEQMFTMRLLSFGFKHSPPSDADLIIDVRSLPNPFYDPNLRIQTGLESDVASYVFQNESAQHFYHQIKAFVALNIDQAIQSGRTGYTVAIGCTGGQHRSVAVVERLAKELTTECLLDHRDLGHADISL